VKHNQGEEGGKMGVEMKMNKGAEVLESA